MKQIIPAGVVGGIIFWVWGFLAWAVLPLHTGTLAPIPGEDALIEVMKNAIPEKGVYQIPGEPAHIREMSEQEQNAAMDSYMSKYRRGPIGILVYNPAGQEPFMPSQMITGLFITILCASMGAWLLSRSTAVTGSYTSRVVYLGVIGVLIAVASHLTAWNWFGYSLQFTTAMMTDVIIGWLLAGLGIAALVKPSRADAGATA